MGKLVGIATRAATKVAMVEFESASVTTERGVEDDFRGAPGKRQVTVLSREAWEKACAEVDTELPWTLRRANLLVEALDLERTSGQRLRIGQVVLEITCETDPCRVMDLQHSGLRAALTPNWRGGASCRVVSGGRISIGDDVQLES